jgi:type I restriction enzyme S subunit
VTSLWSTVPLGDLCSVKAGGTPARSESANYGGEIPWVKISDMLRGDIYETEESISHSGLTNSAAKLLPAGTVLLSIFATIGRTALLRVPAATNQAIVGLIPKDDSIDPGFLRRFLDFAAGSLASRGRGVAQANINSTILKQLPVSLPWKNGRPDIPEQKRIAAILDKADAIRRNRQASLHLLDSLVGAIFLEMFGDPRLENSTGRVSCTPTKLGDLTRIRTGKLDANAADDDGAYPFFTCAVQTLRINTAQFDAKAVLVAGNGDLNVKYYEGKFNAYQRTYVIESKDENILHPKFLFAFLALYVSELRRQAIGGVIKYIKLPYLTDAVIPLPNIHRQREFAACLDAVDSLKSTQTTYLNQASALFEALRHRAFNGSI